MKTNAVPMATTHTHTHTHTHTISDSHIHAKHATGRTIMWGSLRSLSRPSRTTRTASRCMIWSTVLGPPQKVV
jgi:hypothetical protein